MAYMDYTDWRRFVGAFCRLSDNVLSLLLDDSTEGYEMMDTRFEFSHLVVFIYNLELWHLLYKVLWTFGASFALQCCI
jgi:hypothetical protein